MKEGDINIRFLGWWIFIFISSLAWFNLCCWQLKYCSNKVKRGTRVRNYNEIFREWFRWRENTFSAFLLTTFYEILQVCIILFPNTHEGLQRLEENNMSPTCPMIQFRIEGTGHVKVWTLSSFYREDFKAWDSSLDLATYSLRDSPHSVKPPEFRSPGLGSVHNSTSLQGCLEHKTRLYMSRACISRPVNMWEYYFF